MIRPHPRAHRRLVIALALALSVALPGFGPTQAAPLDQPDGLASADGRDAGTIPAADPAVVAVRGSDPDVVSHAPHRTDPTLFADAAEADALLPPPYKVTAYTIRTLARTALPYVGTGFPSKVPPNPHDADGIPMKLVGTRLYYSPAGLAQYGLRHEDAFRRTGDPGYRAIATKVMNKLMAIGVMSDGAVFIPYRFSFAMHRISTEVMRAPWYSAMAQGLALSLAVRLFRDTADPVFKADAEMLFRSFRRIGRGTRPWVTYIDAGRYLWLEEYPEPLTPSDHTANGFNFAVFGLYDYYQETHDPYALQVLRASLTTMRHYISAYRRPGSYSKYCLRHGKPQAKYHTIVTGQLVFLYRMSGDSYFLSMSRLFYSDYH
jgi:hypothetical protein